MSPRNRRSLIPNRSSSAAGTSFSRKAKSAAASPVATVRVAPSQPFSPFRSTIQEPVLSSQGPGRHHGIAHTATTNIGASLATSGKMNSLSRNIDMQSGASCVQQSAAGDKIDPRRVLAVLQELSRSRKRTRERDRGKRLMADCRDHGPNVTGTMYLF